VIERFERLERLEQSVAVERREWAAVVGERSGGTFGTGRSCSVLARGIVFP